LWLITALVKNMNSVTGYRTGCTVPIFQFTAVRAAVIARYASVLRSAL